MKGWSYWRYLFLVSVLSLFAGCFGGCDALIVLLMNFFE